MTLRLHVATLLLMKTVSIREAKNRLTELARIERKRSSSRAMLASVRNVAAPAARDRPEASTNSTQARNQQSPFIADDFDEPLAEDFCCVRCHVIMRLLLDTHVLLAFIERGALVQTGVAGSTDGP